MTRITLARAASRIGFALCAAALFAGNIAAQDMDAAIRKAQQKYASVKTARGTIAQTNTLTTGRKFELRADFQQQFPSLLSVRYSEPKGDVIVGDGKFNWIYFPSATKGIVTRVPLSSAGSIDLVNVFLDSPREKNTLSDAGQVTIDGLVTRAIGLVPKGQAQFRRATVWIEEATGIVRQFEFLDASGTVRRIKFAKLEFNVPVDTSLFKFKVPSGVKIEGG